MPNYPPQQLDIINLNLVRSQRKILSNISFSVKNSEAIILRGDNGVGKTSLLMAIAGYLYTQKGAISWQRGQSEKKQNDEEAQLVNNLHFIGHQNAIKPSLSLRDNLLFWCNLYGGDAQKITKALNKVGLKHAIDLSASLLSAGQSKRLSLARLLVTDRPIWLLDEPTSALDSKGDKLVANMIDNHLDRGGIAIIATHLDLALKQSQRIKALTLKG